MRRSFGLTRQVSSLCVLLCLALAGGSSATTLTGFTTGAFVNPVGPTGMTANGVGTEGFAWGIPTVAWNSPSFLRFAGTSVATEFDTPFSFGTLSYFNGTTWGGTEADSVELAVSLTLVAPAGLARTFEYPLHLINSPNTADPVGSSDSVLFPAVFPTTGFSFDGVNYTLAFDGFGNVTGGGFVPLQDNQFFVLEGEMAAAELFGRITMDPSHPVPEPGTLLLLGGGLVGLAALGRRCKE